MGLLAEIWLKYVSMEWLFSTNTVYLALYAE